jgi:CRISPR type I-E-associated protein CasB/Cse2
MSNESFTEQATERLARLRQRCADPGCRAALRHWLSDAGRPRAYQALMDLRGTLDDEDFNTVAALYAYHPNHSDNGGTLGHVCRFLSAGLSTFEGRFKRLLLCDAGELRQRLQPVILAARAKGVAVDYRRLYLDLRSWDHDFYGDRVRRGWAQDFWAQPETAPTKPQEGPS